MPEFPSRQLRPWFIARFVICCSVVLPCLAQTQTPAPDALTAQGGSVQGRIEDPLGLAVEGATVTMRSILTGAVIQEKSKAAGAFQFTDLEAGDYALSADSAGLAVQNRRVAIRRGQTLDTGEIRLTLLDSKEQVTVVSGSRIKELENESPTEVLVKTQQDMRRTGYERIGDVLSEVPGVVTRVQSFGVSLVGGEQIDGMDSKETLVLLDGLPIAGARGITEGNIDMNAQSVGPIERVEVVKGAASALYGTNALGGVINLITREPSDPVTIDASLSGGTLGAVDGRFGMGTRWKNLTAYGDVESHQSDAYTLIPGDISTVGANENRQDLLFKLRYALNPRAALGFTSTAYHNHDQGFGNTLGIDPTDPYNFLNSPTALRANESTNTFAVTGDFIPWNSTGLQTRFYTSTFDQNSRSNLLNNGVEQSPFDLANLSETYRRADATLGQQIGSRQFVQLGYEWVQDQYRGDNRIVGGPGGQQLTTNDIWLQDRIQPFRNLTLTLGGRFQENSQFGGHVVPKLGAVYRVNDYLIVRASFGEGFRAPDLGELYYHLLHLEYGYQVLGNPKLTPETSQSYSAGGTLTAGRYRLSLNLFRNNLHNLINNVLVCNATTGQVCAGSDLTQLLSGYGVPGSFDYDDTGAALFTFLNQNVDRAYTQGFDVDGGVAFTRSLVFSGAYTYLDAVDSSNNTWLSNRNRHQGHVKLEYAKTRWGLVSNVRGTFFSKWSTDTTGDYAYGYQIWNFYLSKSLYRGLSLFGAIDNFADSRDHKLDSNTPSFDRPDYGRTFRVGMRFTLPHRE